jgi:ATP-dependent helicase/nuclease subunit A
MLELTDLKNPDYYLIDDSKCIDIIKTFLDNDKVKNIKDAIIYKEYEFIYESDNTKYHGIIDLMLEYNNHIDIIDYKLKNTKDDNYNKQLKGYRDYIATKSNKKINLYLYSLLEGNMYEVK